MQQRALTTFVDYYDFLKLPEDAPVEDIQRALELCEKKAQQDLGNSLQYKIADRVLKSYVPAIKEHLLSGTEARQRYDQKRAEHKRAQARNPDDLADDEGLDEQQRRPFFFDPYDYDTEIPAPTLRDIPAKFDEDWAYTQRWIADTSNPIHILVGYLVYAVQRSRLAKKVSQLLDALAGKNGPKMDVNQVIERCAILFNPKIERPTVMVTAPTFDGSVLDVGDCISDLPATSSLTLSHIGVRGCVFGVVESKTPWITFQDGAAQTRFALLPAGTDPEVGPSEITIPLLLRVADLARNADHSGELILRLENWDPQIESAIQVHLRVMPLPPRVSFAGAEAAPGSFSAGVVRRGTPARLVVTAHNAGDEQLAPLAARLSPRDKKASAQPELFHANEPITLTIDTSTRAYGATYEELFDVDYSPTPGASGPATLSVRGELLPTFRQSLFRTRKVDERLGGGCFGLIVGFIGLGLLGAWLAGQIWLWWLLFGVIPALFALLTRQGARRVVAHLHRTGNTQASLANVSPWALWGTPAAAGLVVSIVCLATNAPGIAFLIAGVVGGLVGGLAGFLLDSAKEEQHHS